MLYLLRKVGGIQLSDTKESKQEEKASLTPLIFISHDTRDADLAEAFSRLLSSVSCGVLKSFRSSDKKGSQGIEYGVEWYPELMKKLNDASDIVCLLTKRSVDRPWILYEAGVAKGKLNTPVYGIALGIPLNKANSGPFAQFQNCDDDGESLTKLIMQLVRRIPNSEPDREAIAMQVNHFNENIKKILSRKENEKVSDTNEKIDDASIAKLFEEVKLMFQELPSRIEYRTSSESAITQNRIRQLPPFLIEELVALSVKLNKPIGILIAFGRFRDAQPWLYEIGKDLYYALESGNREEIDRCSQTLLDLYEFAKSGPFPNDLLGGRDIYYALREIPFLVERFTTFASGNVIKGGKVLRPTKVSNSKTT